MTIYHAVFSNYYIFEDNEINLKSSKCLSHIVHLLKLELHIKLVCKIQIKKYKIVEVTQSPWNFLSYRMNLESYIMSHFQVRWKKNQKGQRLPGIRPTGVQKSNACLMEKWFGEICLDLLC